MSVPKEILAVDRPANTVVFAYGKNKDYYAVRQSVGCRYVNGRRVPVTGPTIGHIVDMAYVPLVPDFPRDVPSSSVTIKDWADIFLCDSLFSDLKGELYDFFPVRDAVKIYCIAILRVCYPGIRDHELKEAYENSFLSELCPGAAISKNTVSKLFSGLTPANPGIGSFMKDRGAKFSADQPLLVGCVRKTDGSGGDSLSDISRKIPGDRERDLTVFYAFDPEAWEPVCSRHCLGKVSFLEECPSFMEGTGITDGFVITEGDTPFHDLNSVVSAYPQLHYLRLLPRNAKQIEKYGLCHSYTGPLPDSRGVIYRKEKESGKRKWLYAYMDSRKAAEEKEAWLGQFRGNGSFSPEESQEMDRSFGTLAFESDLDLPPETVYRTYTKQREIELVMRHYHSAREAGSSGSHGAYNELTAFGTEFCDFLASLLTFRLMNTFEGAGLLNRMTFSEIMASLQRAKKFRGEDGNWELVNLTESHRQVLQALNLVPGSEDLDRRRPGRPRKNPL